MKLPRSAQEYDPMARQYYSELVAGYSSLRLFRPLDPDQAQEIYPKVRKISKMLGGFGAHSEISVTLVSTEETRRLGFMRVYKRQEVQSMLEEAIPSLCDPIDVTVKNIGKFETKYDTLLSLGAAINDPSGRLSDETRQARAKLWEINNRNPLSFRDTPAYADLAIASCWHDNGADISRYRSAIAEVVPRGTPLSLGPAQLTIL